ncbi:unnamed protein product [Pylaiella littoralis]
MDHSGNFCMHHSGNFCSPVPPPFFCSFLDARDFLFFPVYTRTRRSSIPRKSSHPRGLLSSTENNHHKHILLLSAAQVLATLLVVTHVAAMVFASTGGLVTLPSWFVRTAIIAISVRMFFTRDMDNSFYQEMIMISCLYAAAVDLYWAWAWLDAAGNWVSSVPQLAAAIASIFGAKAHLPSNILEDRRRFTALLLVATHGVAFFFGATFYAGFRWLVYFVGVALSARLFWTKVEDVNVALGTLTIVACMLLAAADLWIAVWCLTPTYDDDDLPSKWIMVIPNVGAALASVYTSYTLVQDRKLLADILVTV